MTLKAVITKCPCFLFHRAELRNREMTDLGVQALNVGLFALQLSLFRGGLLIARRYGKLPVAVKSMQDHINLLALICFKRPALYIFCPRKVSSTFAHFMHFRSVKTWLNLLHSTAIVIKGAVSNNPHYANHPKSGCNSGKETKNLTYTFTAFVLIRGDVNGKDACGEFPKAPQLCVVTFLLLHSIHLVSSL